MLVLVVPVITLTRLSNISIFCFHSALATMQPRPPNLRQRIGGAVLTQSSSQNVEPQNDLSQQDAKGGAREGIIEVYVALTFNVLFSNLTL